MIFTEMGLPVPKQNDIRTWLCVDGMAAHGSLRMIKSLKAENENLREGIQALEATNDELAEANENQRLEIEQLRVRLRAACRVLGWPL